MDGRVSQKPAGRVRATAARALGAALAVNVAAGVAWGQAAPAPAPAPVPAAAPAAAPASVPAGEAEAPAVEVSDAEVNGGPGAVAGARMALEVARGAAEGTRFRWVQTEGPPVAIDDPTRPAIQVTLPAGCDRLGFVLIAWRADGLRVVRVHVPIHGAAGDAPRPAGAARSWGPRPSGKVRADAGDDQIGLVGHQVTLNGSRSVPGGGTAARWVQVAGPAVDEPRQQGAFFSFVPRVPGTYRFLLVVSAAGEVSEPDEVSVTVGTPPAAAGVAGPTAATPAPPAAAPVAPAPTLEQAFGRAIPLLDDGPRIGSEVADVLEALADRASLYSSFAVLQNEMARRLDVVVPAEPAARAAWSQAVFAPMTARTVERFLRAGLDLRQPQGLHQPLTAAQQEQVRDHFLTMARACRAASAVR